MGESFLTDPPQPQAMAWLRASLPGSWRLNDITPLAGAFSSALHMVEAEDEHGALQRLSWRRFVRKNWLEEEPDLAWHESMILRFLESTPVNAPRVVAVDEDGSECDVPCVLMTWLPGRVELMPSNVDDWVEQMARELVKVHAIEWRDVDRMPAWFPFNQNETLVVPGYSKAPEAWRTIIDVVNLPPRPPSTDLFIHRDYHPGNILWTGDRLTSVIDWVNGCHGAPEIDVGHCAWNITDLVGPDAADAFRAHYEAMSGRKLDPFWELWAASDIGQTAEQATQPPSIAEQWWTSMGAPAVPVDTIIARMDEFAQRTASRYLATR